MNLKIFLISLLCLFCLALGLEIIYLDAPAPKFHIGELVRLKDTNTIGQIVKYTGYGYEFAVEGTTVIVVVKPEDLQSVHRVGK